MREVQGSSNLRKFESTFTTLNHSESVQSGLEALNVDSESQMLIQFESTLAQSESTFATLNRHSVF